MSNLFMDFFTELTCDISPTDFEKFCMEFLRAYAEKEKLSEFNIKHNVKIEASDGIYQIDIYAEFVAMNCKFKVLAECKKYNKAVSRDKVEILYSRLQSLGMNKGILISTSGFQSGAIQFAKSHGIALIQVSDKSIDFYSASANNSDLVEIIEKRRFMEYPKYVAKEIVDENYVTIRVYPTDKMLTDIHNTIIKEIMKGES